MLPSKSEPLTEDERAFLQRRVGAFGLVGGGCFGAFLLYRTVLMLFLGTGEELRQPSFWYHLLATFCLLGLWAVCRVGRLQGGVIRAAETAGILGVTVASGLMASHIERVNRPDFVLLLALTFAMMARAVWVPSSARRSLLLGLAVGVELGAVGYFLLTGQHVFEGATVVEVCGHHLHSVPVPPSQRVGRPLHPELERLILQCLAKDPAERPRTARELEQSLDAMAAGDPWTPDAAHAWWVERRTAQAAKEAPGSPDSPEVALTIEVRKSSGVRP